MMLAQAPWHALSDAVDRDRLSDRQCPTPPRPRAVGAPGADGRARAAKFGLCVGIDSANEVVWSTTPLGGASTWKSRLLETDAALTSVACPSPRACLIADTAGRLALGVTHSR